MSYNHSKDESSDWKIVFHGGLFAMEKHTIKWYERAVRPPGVRLVLKNKEDKYLITKEFRSEQWGFDYRLPWGKVFDDLDSYLDVRYDETKLQKWVLKAARIEAKEEAWVDEIDNLKIIHTSKAGASVEWTLYYLTWSIIKLWEQDLWGDEAIHGIEVWFYSQQEILDMIHSWEMKEERSIAVLIKYFGK